MSRGVGRGLLLRTFSFAGAASEPLPDLNLFGRIPDRLVMASGDKRTHRDSTHVSATVNLKRDTQAAHTPSRCKFCVSQGRKLVQRQRPGVLLHIVSVDHCQVGLEDGLS